MHAWLPSVCLVAAGSTTAAAHDLWHLPVICIRVWPPSTLGIIPIAYKLVCKVPGAAYAGGHIH